MEPGFLAATIKMIVIFILITFLIFLLVYLLKRFRLKSLSIKGVPQIRLVNILNLAPKKSVALVEVSGEWLVLGLGAESVTLLTKLAHPPGVEEQGGVSDPGHD